MIPYTSYISQKQAKVGFTKFIFTDGRVGLVPRRTESNFRGF